MKRLMMKTGILKCYLKAVIAVLFGLIMASFSFVPVPSYAQEPAHKFDVMEERLASEAASQIDERVLAQYNIEKDAKELIAKIIDDIRPLYTSKQNALAIAYAEQALSISEKYLGPDDPVTAINLNNLAVIFMSENNYKNAKTLNKRAFEITFDTLGLSHCATSSIANTLIELNNFQGPPEAKIPIQDIRSINDSSFCSNHPYSYSYETDPYTPLDIFNLCLFLLALILLCFYMAVFWRLISAKLKRTGSRPEVLKD